MIRDGKDLESILASVQSTCLMDEFREEHDFTLTPRSRAVLRYEREALMRFYEDLCLTT